MYNFPLLLSILLTCNLHLVDEKVNRFTSKHLFRIDVGLGLWTKSYLRTALLSQNISEQEPLTRYNAAEKNGYLPHLSHGNLGIQSPK